MLKENERKNDKANGQPDEELINDIENVLLTIQKFDRRTIEFIALLIAGELTMEKPPKKRLLTIVK